MTVENAVGKYHIENSLQRMMDLVCCGLESGPYGSFTIVGYEKPAEIKVKLDDFSSYMKPEERRVYRHIDYPFNDGGAVLFKVKDGYAETPEEQETVYKLNRETLVKGMQILLEKYPRIYGDWVKENDDALTGDAFIQCCLLGDVVYG